jgi:hypothetical protein
MVIKAKDLIVLVEKIKHSPAYIAAMEKKEAYKGKPLYTKDDDNFLVVELVDELEKLIEDKNFAVNDLVEVDLVAKKVEVDSIEIKVD